MTNDCLCCFMDEMRNRDCAENIDARGDRLRDSGEKKHKFYKKR